MANTIINFFDFLEKKKGKKLPNHRKAELKLVHAKELMNDKEIGDLPFLKKLAHFPEKLKKEDFIIDGDLIMPLSTTKLPEGLVVKGMLTVQSNINTVTNYVSAESVDWRASSKYYPKSFTGATFFDFGVGPLYKAITTLPEKIIVKNVLAIGGSEITRLPEGLIADKIIASKSKLEKLPQTLECNVLDIRETAITEIPAGIVVHKQLLVSKVPNKYPQELEDKLARSHDISFNQLKEYEKLPEIVAGVGTKTKKGKGIEIPLSDIENKEFKDVYLRYKDKYSKYESLIDSIRKVAQQVGGVLDIEFTTVYLFIQISDYSFYSYFMIKGKDKQGREVLKTEGGMYDKDKLISAEGEVSTASVDWKAPTERMLQTIENKLFPSSSPKVKKPVGIRQLMTGPNSKVVYWEIGKKTRGGQGIQGQAKDLIPSLSGPSQDNMTRASKKYNVTWGDMIAFENRKSINVIARSNEQDADGNYLYFDKFGFGRGGGTKVFKDKDYKVG